MKEACGKHSLGHHRRATDSWYGRRRNSRGWAGRHREPWSAAEDEVVGLRFTIEETARILSRSIDAVEARRRRLAGTKS